MKAKIEGAGHQGKGKMDAARENGNQLLQATPGHVGRQEHVPARVPACVPGCTQCRTPRWDTEAVTGCDASAELLCYTNTVHILPGGF